MGQYSVIVVTLGILFVFILIISFLRRYKRCPSDRILVIYGKVGIRKRGGIQVRQMYSWGCLIYLACDTGLFLS